MNNFFNVLFGNRNEPKHYNLSLNTIYYQAVWQSRNGIKIGGKNFSNGTIHLDSGIGDLEVVSLREALGSYGKSHPSTSRIAPQFATLVYDVTQKIDCMQSYFPVTSNEQSRNLFFQELDFILTNPNFQLNVWGINGDKVTKSAPPGIRILVAGHIAEVLFKRPKLLRQFFKKLRFFNIYMNEQAYINSGGVSGGCYDPASESIKLNASRLYEGFYGYTPGVIPFIHEFGHMLDSFDVNTAEMQTATGLLLGMHRSDFDFYSIEAKELWLFGISRGKSKM